MINWVHLYMPAPRFTRDFFARPTVSVARDLLGTMLYRRFADGSAVCAPIVELEAYTEDDPACHAFRGITERCRVLFGPPGIAYVYFIYGMYNCLNISCEPDGQAGGVLIRALEPVEGLATMAKLRKLPPNPKPQLLTSGPGRLCQALDITRAAHNGLYVTDPRSCLRIEDDGYRPEGIAVTPRIGIRHAADMLARFLIRGNQFVSGRA